MIPQTMQLYVEVARAAASQWGLFTSGQAGRIGATAQHMSGWAKRGLVEREAHGLYRIVGAPDDDLGLDGLRSAWLLTAPTLWRYERDSPAVVSHLSAAHTVWGLGTASPKKDHLTVVSQRRTRAANVRLHVDTLPEHAWQWVDGLPVTTVCRTVADLHAAGLDGGHLGDIVRDALRGGYAARDLAQSLDHVSEGRGRQVLEEALATCGAPASLAAASDILAV